MAGNFILSNGDVEYDVVPPYADVEPGNFDVHPRKSDVARHVKRVIRGFFLESCLLECY